MTKKVITFDSNTGESSKPEDIPDGMVLQAVYPKRLNGFKEGWLAVSQEALEAWADANLQQETYRVLMKICGRLDFENYILINQTEIASSLGMRQPNFARSLKRLVDAEILFKGPRAGRQFTYRLNPHYGWKGKAINHQHALKETGKMLQFPTNENS